MGEDNVKKPLLERKYYENCPGCKVDQAKELSEGQGVPIKNLLIIWMVVLCACCSEMHMLGRRQPLEVRDFNIAKTESDISSYAGYVGKAYATELFRKEHQAIGISTVSAAWGIGLIIGPALGGYLAQLVLRRLMPEIIVKYLSFSVSACTEPVEKYPHIFPKDSFWDKFPYSLPSFIISALAVVVAIGCIWIPETLHNHNCSNEFIDDAEALENGSNSADKDRMIRKNENLLLNWPLMSSIIAYCVFSLHDIAYQEVFSLWAVSPQRLGGLNFTTDDVGNVLSISGLALIIYQLTIYPSVEKASGPIGIARISGMLSLPLLQSYPFIALLSGVALYTVLSIASILKNILSMTIITGLFLLQNRAVEQHQRGAANGLSMTGTSLFKAIGPATGGAILTWSQKRMDASFLPGTHMVFSILNIVEGLGIVMMFRPFLVEKKKTHSDQLH
ncbi:hypothetical protein Fmac_025273 [Flemingia macrophylla]|uniref:Protein ZINC INDUCED FACILITATOR-LIKE 1 n=1 Tax=Flemingia macrophylla TaxID=520843 RepID=A0ABD1LRS8_9FABA